MIKFKSKPELMILLSSFLKEFALFGGLWIPLFLNVSDKINWGEGIAFGVIWWIGLQAIAHILIAIYSSRNEAQ